MDHIGFHSLELEFTLVLAFYHIVVLVEMVGLSLDFSVVELLSGFVDCLEFFNLALEVLF